MAISTWDLEWIFIRGVISFHSLIVRSGGISRPHVERMQNLAEQGASALMLKSIQQKESDAHGRNNLEGIAEQILLPTTVTAVTDRFAVRSHLRAVAAAKRYKPHSSQRWFGS